MEAACAVETVELYQITLRHIQKTLVFIGIVVRTSDIT
jgi:hypothetical protein